jgi:hypothetical protein
VAMLAMCFLLVHGSRPNAAQHIFPARDQFKVGRVDTATISTFVINRKRSTERPFEQKIGPLMGEHLDSVYTHPAITGLD